MKKLIISFVSTLIIINMLTVTAFAASTTLPDGGQVANSGYQTVYGRSSGGTNGYANLTCTVTTTNGFLLGKDSATSKTRSNVSTGLTGTLVVSVWNSSVDTYADASNKVYPISTIPSDGVTSTVKATSNGAFYALGGHSVSYNLYGEWVCGTKEYF